MDSGPRWYGHDKNGRRHKLPGLSDLQVAALACVRDDLVTTRVWYERYVTYSAEGHDVTCQMRSLRKRRLIYFRSDGSRLFRLSLHAPSVLARYPEY